MRRIGWILLGGAAFLGLLVWPEAVLESLRQSVSVCAEVLIPSLFPFLILTGLLTEAGIGRFAALPAMLGGFPVAARTFAAEAARGRLTPQAAASRVAALTCSGPAFVLTAVGVGMCGSRSLGWMLLAGQWIAAAILYTAVLVREKRRHKAVPNIPKIHSVPPTETRTFSAALVAVTRSSALAMGLICAYVLLFAALTSLLGACGLFQTLRLLPGDGALWEAAVRGVFEVTLGCKAASACTGTPAVLLLAFLLGFGGLSVWAQVQALAPELPLRRYLPVRILFGAIAAAVTGLLVWLFPPLAATSAPVAARASGSYVGSVALLMLCTALICQKSPYSPHPTGFWHRKNGYNTVGTESQTKSGR